MVAPVQDLPFITKVLPPRRRIDAAPRPRLLDALRAGLQDRRVQIVWAPAGYGKTVLLTDLAAQAGMPVGWYALTPEDREPAAFVGYCVKAVELSGALPTLVTQELMALAVRQDWHMALGQLVNALHGHLRGDMLFVFDDLHEIDSSQEVREALSLFIERAPEGVRFLLSSRSRPSVPCLPRLTVQDEVASFSMQDLRFSAEETAALLSLRWRRAVTEQEAGPIAERAGGWPTGIALLARAGKSLKEIEASGAAEDLPLFDYLTEEVFHKLPERLQRFLLHTSVLREFTADLCDKLLGREDSQDLLRELKDGGHFIEERSSPAPVYRYHDLFREYLERTLRSRDAETHRTLHRKAAALAEVRGDEGAALAHLTTAGDAEQAADLLRRVAEPQLQRGRWQTLQAWLSLLPAGLVGHDFQLLLLQAKVHLRLGQPIAAVECLERVIADPASAQGVALGRALVTKSFADRLLGNVDAAAESAKRGLEALRAANASSQDVAEGYRQLASALGTRGAFAEARQSFELALALAPDGDLQLRSLVHDGLAATSVEMGALDTAGVHLEKARQGWLKLGNEGALAESLNNLAFVYYYRGEFDIALDELVEAQRAAVSAGYQRLVATARISQGIVHRALRNYSVALGCFLTGLEEARQVLDHRLVAEATNGLGNTYRRLGEPDKAATLLKKALIEAEQSGQGYVVARYLVSLGKVYAQMGALDDALQSLQRADALFREQGSLRGAAEVKLHQGLTLYRLGRTDDALAATGQLAELLERLGYDGFLVADGDEAADLLRLSAAKGPDKKRFSGLLRRLEGSRENSQKTAVAGTGRALPTIRAFGFGEGQVFLESHQIGDHEWKSRKAKELFYFLLQQKSAVGKEQLIEALWPDGLEGNSDYTLRMTVHRLRKALYPEFVLKAGEGLYTINPEAPVEFDLSQFQDLIQQADGHDKGSKDRIKMLAQSVALYKAPFLSDFYSEWCQALRRSLERKYQHALIELADHHAAKGNFSSAIELLERVVSSDPYDEAANFLLAKGYLQAGDSLSALKRIREYIRLVREELQTEPSTQLLELYRLAVRQEPFTAAAVR